MPEINLSSLNQLFQQAGTDRLQREFLDNGTTRLSTTESHTDGRASNLGKIVRTRAARAQGSGAAAVGRAAEQAALGQRTQMRRPYGGSLGGAERLGWVLTTEIWRKQDRAIFLHAGPSSANWTLPFRVTDEETKSGHARFAQARSGGHGSSHTDDTTYFGFPQIGFEFQSGNILPLPQLLGEVEVPYGLDDFYLFLEMTNQPPLVPSGIDEGKNNYVWMFYTSPKFPSLVIRGYFEQDGISWVDDVENGGGHNWSATFMAHEMTPNLWQRSELVDAYRNVMRAATLF